MLLACSDQSGVSAPTEGVAASEHTIEKNRAVARDLPLDDQQDFEDARRGFIAVDTPLTIASDAGGTGHPMILSRVRRPIRSIPRFGDRNNLITLPASSK